MNHKQNTKPEQSRWARTGAGMFHAASLCDARIPTRTCPAARRHGPQIHKRRRELSSPVAPRSTPRAAPNAMATTMLTTAAAAPPLAAGAAPRFRPPCPVLNRCAHGGAQLRAPQAIQDLQQKRTRTTQCVRRLVTSATARPVVNVAFGAPPSPPPKPNAVSVCVPVDPFMGPNLVPHCCSE